MSSDGGKVAVSDRVLIEFDHVTKSYSLYKNDRARALQALFGGRAGRLGTVDANHDLSFKIRCGEGVALVGSNGAGKSTALKMITGVSHPTSGRVSVNGTVGALLELNAGFDSHLTGRENIYLRGYVMGMSKRQIREMEPAVVEFADLGAYIDQPMTTYSSGMRSRIGFAMAVSLTPDILIIDETLSVGDAAFQAKCLARVRQIVQTENVTVLFVSHSAKMVTEFCSRGIVLEKGRMLFDGPVGEAIEFYDGLGKKSLADATVELPYTTHDYTGKALWPRPTVTLDGEVLKWQEHYKLYYYHNRAQGTATVKVVGKGDYRGTLVATFEIVGDGEQG